MLPGLEDRLEEAFLFKPRFCERHCGAQVLGKLYEYHLKEECPLRQVDCPEGCGERVQGSDLDVHRASCPMGMFLTRAEAAIREQSMREFRIATDGAYAERERARARMRARGEEDFRRDGWPSKRAEVRVKAIEQESRELVMRSRRRAVEHLTTAIAATNAEGGQEDKAGPVNALKYWDSFYAVETQERAARPWDLDCPSLQRLLDALEEAAICSADAALRRRGEARLIAALKRTLESALNTPDDLEKVLKGALQTVRDALHHVELEDPCELFPLIQRASEEATKATLQQINTAVPEFFKAVAEGDLDLCKWLLERERASPSLPDPRLGMAPIVLAAKNGDMPMCRTLLEWKAHVDERCLIDGCSALHWAAHSRNFRVMSELLERKANPRLQDKRGIDALMKLVRRDFSKPAEGCGTAWEVIEGRRLPGPELPGSGVMDVDSAQVAAEANEDAVGFSFRLEGAISGLPRWHIILCGAGDAGRRDPSPSRRAAVEEAAPSSPSGARSSPPSPSSPSGTRSPNRRAMEASGGLPELQPAEEDDEAESSWVSYLKVRCDPTHDLRLLLASGADATARDRLGLTALHHHLRSSATRGDAAVVAELLRGGADVNARCETERAETPLSMAVSAKRADLVRLMLTEAFPPADVDGGGASLLALAEASGSTEVAKLLRDNGAMEWNVAEVRLGARTTFSFDTRKPPVRA